MRFLAIIFLILLSHSVCAAECRDPSILRELSAPYYDPDQPLDLKAKGTVSFDRLPTAHFTQQFAPAIGRIEIEFNNGFRDCADTCTGFIVSPKHVLTAHHCIPGAQSNTYKITRAVIRFGFDKDGIVKENTRVYELQTVAERDNYDVQLDYSLVAFAEDCDCLTRFGRVRLSGAEPRDGEPLIIIQHPLGGPRRYASDCLASRTDDLSLIKHDCATFRGSSGSPIFGQNSMEVVGIHTGRERGVTLAAIVSNSPILQRELEPAAKEAPLALLRGAYVFLGKRSALSVLRGDQANADAPFGRAVLEWVAAGNPLSGEPLTVRVPVNVRSRPPRVGNMYGRIIRVLAPGLTVAARSYAKYRMVGDDFYFAQIEEVR